MTSLPHEKQRKEVKEMNTLVIVLIAAVCLFGAYTLYGRWLANKWGIDPTAKTPAVVHEDGRDYVPTNGWTVFAHQFSSIAGAGPVTGAIQAAAFGWLPVLLWVLLGGIFFGAVTDFGALYASVKNDGKSMGMLIEKYIGKTGRKLFLLFFHGRDIHSRSAESPPSDWRICNNLFKNDRLRFSDGRPGSQKIISGCGRFRNEK